MALGHGSVPSNYPVQYSTCVYGDSSFNTYHTAMAARPDVIPPVCTPAAAGNRTWGTAAAMNGSTGAVEMSIQQWLQERSSYSRSAVLDDEGKFVLYWNVSVDANKENGVIRFAAEVETVGWVGLGLSPTGAMVDSDSVIGWVHSVEEGAAATVVDLTDRWNAAYVQPAIDVSQDVYRVRGVQARLMPTPPPINPIYYNVSGGGALPSGDGSPSGASVPLIVAAVAGSLLLLVVVIGVALWWRQRSSAVSTAEAESMEDDGVTGSSRRRVTRNGLQERLLV